MTTDLIAAARHLADVLTQENDALKRADYTTAAALVPVKQAALAALPDAPAPAGFPAPLARALRDLATENQNLLTLAITVQTRIVQIVARACGPPPAQQRYAPRSGRIAPTPATALALSTRA